MFAGLTIIPNLLHLAVYRSNGKIFIHVNLEHHIPELRDDHELKLGSKYICVGCIGSFIGIIVAEMVFIIYFFFPDLFELQNSNLFLFIAFFLVLVSYSRYFLSLPPKLRIFQHLSLFVGLSLAVIANDIFFNSTLIMIFFLPVWILFLLARVQLSKIDHSNSS